MTAVGAGLRALTFVALMALGACSRQPDVQFFPAEAYPERLSDWGLIVRDADGYQLGSSVFSYDLNTPLFSDYALKLRAIFLPPGTAATYRADGPFELPVGSIIAKTFFYPVDGAVLVAESTWSGHPEELDPSRYRLIETRLLVRQADGWDALPYVWSGDDAYLRLTGSLERFQIRVAGELTELPYVVPARNECAGCHATDHDSGALEPIGVAARHLNRLTPDGTTNQLEAWTRAGRLAGLPDAANRPSAADYAAPTQALDQRARAYLDINCGHCHNPRGAAATSGLRLDAHATEYRELGFCKPPIAAGRGSGGNSYAIVPGEPDASILAFRMATTDPGMRMPETGRSLVHTAGLELIRDWIESLPGSCI